MKSSCRLLLLVLLLWASLPVRAQAPSLPAALQAQLPEPMSQLGAGEMRWFGLKIYDASLWTAAGRPWSAESRFALAIRYARDIEGQRLVETSIDEIRRLKLSDDAQLAAWRPLLARVLPSVREGDVLIGIRQPEGGAQFWHNGKTTGQISEPALARAFFAIWLDPRSREPALRERLLGQLPASS